MKEKTTLVERNYDNDNDNHDQDYEIREEESSVGGSRWNPTKEQIEMLERIYSHEGIRTPSAEQIQQITSRLRVYGHIEGKNVFYWFQNHKARQRQKQRLERLASANVNHLHNHTNNHINRYLGHHPNHYHNPTNNASVNGVNLHPNPIFPAPPSHHNYPYHYVTNPNVICSPYYNLPQATNDIGYHAQANDYHALMKRPKHGQNNNGVPHGSTLNGYCTSMMKNHYDNHNHNHNHGCDMMMGTRTLDLFPVHPTGILEHKFVGISSTDNSAANSCGGSSSSSDTNTFGDEKHQILFDFFSSATHAST